MELLALDIGYHAEEWTETCRKTWVAFMAQGPALDAYLGGPMVDRMIKGEMLKRGRIFGYDPAEPSYLNASYEELLEASTGVPAIQFQPVFSVSSSLHP